MAGFLMSHLSDYRARTRHIRMPLMFVVGRYFVYIILGAVAIGGLILGLFIMLINAHVVYPAYYGERHIHDDVVRLAAEQSLDRAAIPSPYRFVVLSPDGTDVQVTDAPDEVQRRVLAQLERHKEQGETSLEDVSESSSGYSFQGTRRADGTWLVLAYDVIPQWSDVHLRDTLVNPQDAFIAATLVLFLVLVVAIAVRASHVVSAKFQPLIHAVEEIAAHNLDFVVESSNVTQIQVVGEAMERMRVSLKDSLEQQWEAQVQQREQISALAHDLKTPLTIIRGNAELLADQGSYHVDAAANESEQMARDIVDAARSADDFIARIIAVSRGDDINISPCEVRFQALMNSAVSQARSVAVLKGHEFIYEEKPADADLSVMVDQDAYTRAFLNVVHNACSYGQAATPIRCCSCVDEQYVSVVVEDEGPGFSQAALHHATEWFSRGDRARSHQRDDEQHYGLGLATASQIMKAYGGAVLVENRISDTGVCVGARVTLKLPRLTTSS